MTALSPRWCYKAPLTGFPAPPYGGELPNPASTTCHGLLKPAQSCPIVREPELRSGSASEDRQTLHFISHFSLKKLQQWRAQLFHKPPENNGLGPRRFPRIDFYQRPAVLWNGQSWRSGHDAVDDNEGVCSRRQPRIHLLQIQIYKK